jgi:hypothetical protein
MVNGESGIGNFLSAPNLRIMTLFDLYDPI